MESADIHSRRNLQADWLFGSYLKTTLIHAVRISGASRMETSEMPLAWPDRWPAGDVYGNPFPVATAEPAGVYAPEATR